MPISTSIKEPLGPRPDNRKALRVVFVVTAFPRGPAEVLNPWLIRLIEELRERDIRVEVLTSSYKGRKSESVRGIRVERFRYFFAGLERLSHDMSIPERLKSNRAYYLLLPFFLCGGAVASLAHGLRSGDDIVHVHFPFPLALFGLIMNLVHRRPLIYSCHGSDVYLARANGIYRLLFRGLLSRAGAVIVNSASLRDRVLEMAPGARVSIIPMGASARGPADRQRSKPAQEPARILFVGRLIELKGLPHLLEAMRILANKQPSRFSLHVVGDGPERGAYEKRAEQLNLTSGVRFMGYLQGPALEREYASADIFVLPSIVDSRGFTEGLGTVLLEAIESGLAVVGSRVGGIPDIVKHRETGLLVDPAAPEALAEAIEILADDPALRDRLVRNAKDHVARNFSWEVIASRYEVVYRSLAGHSQGG